MNVKMKKMKKKCLKTKKHQIVQKKKITLNSDICITSFFGLTNPLLLQNVFQNCFLFLFF